MNRRMIGAWERVLVLAPHTDDGEFGCGGTMARLVEAGAEVRYVAFSIATRSLPEGFAPDTLAKEVREATAELGIAADRLAVHDFDVRTFPDHRQDILELLVALWEEWRPDAVFQPSLHDIHQDHQVIAAEGLRAFKRTTILGYEIPWNNFDFAYQAYFALDKSHVERTVQRSRVHPQRRADARHQRQPRVRGGLRGLSRRRLGGAPARIPDQMSARVSNAARVHFSCSGARGQIGAFSRHGLFPAGSDPGLTPKRTRVAPN
jgi:N-acetylglucosamine malate deacetylase 1